jgi:hypothetical protein
MANHWQISPYIPPPFQNSTISGLDAFATCPQRDVPRGDDMCLVDPTIPGNRLREEDGQIELQPINPFYRIGEGLRPLVDGVSKLVSKIVEIAPYILRDLFQRSTSQEAPAKLVASQAFTALVKEETCPLMSTWLNFTKLMCENGGGITISPMKTEHAKPDTGIVVALRGYSKIIPAIEFCSCGKGSVIVERYVNEHSDVLSEPIVSSTPKPYAPHFGAWFNQEDEKVYLDLSVVFPEEDVERALVFAREQNQIAAYHISQGREIPTGGTGTN